MSSNGIGYTVLCNPSGDISVCLNCKASVCVLDRANEPAEEKTAYLPEYIAFGKAVAKARKRIGMSRVILADKCGVNLYSFQTWEKGERPFPAEIKHKLELIFPELEAYDNETKHT